VLRRVQTQVGSVRDTALTHLDQNAPCEAEFQSLHDRGRSTLLRFVNQQMKVFGHDDISDDNELILLSDLLQHLEKQVTTRGTEKRLTTVTTTRDEMKFFVAVLTCQIPGHVVGSRVS
jgi:hypothetical protein